MFSPDGRFEIEKMTSKLCVLLVMFSGLTLLTAEDYEDGSLCTSPPHPENGYYRHNRKIGTPGVVIEEDTYLIYICNKGFKLIGDRSVLCEKGGKLSPVPKCKRICSGLSSTTVDLRCKYQGKIVDCSDDLPSGTVISLYCKTGHELIQGSLNDLECLEGNWTRSLPLCRKVSTKKCTLPDYPIGGTYEPNNKKPGMLVDVQIGIKFMCKDDYELIGPKAIICLENGMWSDQPRCVRACKHLTSLTVDMRCLYNNRETDCSSRKLEGFKIYPECKPLHRKLKGTSDVLTCVNGSWDSALPQCDLDCGEEKKFSGTPLILGAKTESRLNSPWHVGIYAISGNKYTLECGGTIVSTKLVVTAAHCFSPVNRKVMVNSYALAAGKFYREWEHKENHLLDYIQRKTLEKVYLHPNYNGVENNLQGDIAVAVIDIPFQFSLSVHAACLETSNFYIPAYGSYGKLVGWGVTEEGNENSASKELLRTDIPLVDEETCVTSVEPTFTKFVRTLGKFCAGNLTGATPCNGDSGGGILFNKTDGKIERWYLKGIVSVSAWDETHSTCKSHSYTVFTNVSSHAEFLRKIIKIYSEGCALPAQPLNGMYVMNDEHLKPGAIVPEHTVLTYSCDDDYEPDPENKAYCLSGYWNATIECRFAPEDESTVHCILPPYPEHGTYLVNGKPLSPGGRVEPFTFLYYMCEDNYVVNDPTNVYCDGGKWTKKVRCVDCGRYPSDGSPGTPWTVGIYKKRGTQFRYNCGGTILTNKVVVSAAHCFLLSFGTVVLSNFMVTTGKYHRRWNPSEENNQPHITYSTVSNIYIPEKYKGYELDFKYDIAVVVLDKTIEFTDHVRPICYNFNPDEFEKLPGTVGETIGWGFTTARMNDKFPQTLTNYAMTVVDFETCRNNASQWLRRLITADKICAFWNNNTEMCRNGKGDGLFFKVEEKGMDRWYLRGVSSTNEEDPTVACNMSYSFFTDLSVFQDFIENIVDMY